MSKPPNKGGTEKPVIPTIKLPPGNQYQTRATTQAANTTKAVSTQGGQPKDAKGSKGRAAENNNEEAPSTNNQKLTTLQTVTQAIHIILRQARPEKKVKTLLEDIVKFISNAEERDKERAESIAMQPEVSTLHKAIKQDLSKMHEALAKQIDGVLDTASATLENMEKALAITQNLSEATKEISSKVGKVNDATDKIASDSQTYRDVLAQSPAVVTKFALDPKVLGDMERKARQILIDIFDEDGNNTLANSLTELIAKANEAIGKIVDADKPDKIIVESAIQTRKGGLLMSLNSKEAASWLRIPEHEIAFTDIFSKGSHIRERTFNLIVPRVPIIFEPGNKSHLRELEEANNLADYTIRRARWIKPIERRRAGQTHAYAILVITSAEYANLLIRDGMNICGVKVRPAKQKTEPIQCMKCRNWGHFAGECPASDDTCGTCGGKHRTNTCRNKENLWCVTCERADHASWDRNCPEFNRRCCIMDERNPENSMPYFPTEQEWSQTVRQNRIPMEERFPGMYAVNSLPLYGTRQRDKGPRKPRGRSNTPPPRNTASRGPRPADRFEGSYPNSIPVDRGSRQPTNRTNNDTAPDFPERPNWMEEIADQCVWEAIDAGQTAPGAGRHI
jgi:hypothetical protein